MPADTHATLALDPDIAALLAEVVVCCDLNGTILYANPVAQRWSSAPLVGRAFEALLAPGSTVKGAAFLTAAAAASVKSPTAPWELGLFQHDDFTMASFCGYCVERQIVVLGQVEPEQVSTMQRELLALNADLAESQRAQHRQNQALQQALAEQRRLLQTIQELSAPAAPFWPGALLLPLIGNIDSHRATLIIGQLLDRVSADQARFVILDVSGIATIDTSVARYLLSAAQAVRLLGAQTVLVGITPEIAQTLVSLGVELRGLITLSNLQHAVAYVLQRLGGVSV